MKFHKYQGTGNDFIMIDNRGLTFDKTDKDKINLMCDRRFGIGADGLILVEDDDVEDFKMVYFNADGSESTMCGNGGRCIVRFAQELGVFDGDYCRFLAIDGLHEATVDSGTVKLKMGDVEKINIIDKDYELNTGSPHYIRIVDDLENVDIFAEGQKIRYSDPYHAYGINVNFIQKEGEDLHVATYERGVEDETFSCGTGVTAAALAYRVHDEDATSPQSIKTKGGALKVYYEVKNNKYINIYLEGPASEVYEGEYN